MELEALARATTLLTSRPVVAHGRTARRVRGSEVAGGRGGGRHRRPGQDRPGPGWSAGFLGGVLDVCGGERRSAAGRPADEVLTRATHRRRCAGSEFRSRSEPSSPAGRPRLRVLGGSCRAAAAGRRRRPGRGRCATSAARSWENHRLVPAGRRRGGHREIVDGRTPVAPAASSRPVS
ncbi:hypothetical protein HBB16_18590 [Pseudonocardia sp. MCCB 268]|nr:hypothetical protein [Pseudonocardia cytotoxica]